MLTLVGCRLLAVLPGQVLNIIQGNGPQNWLATQSSFKHDLMGQEKALRARRERKEEGEESPPGISPGTPQCWPPRPGLVAIGAEGARPRPTQPAGPWHCSGAPSARPCLRVGPGQGRFRVSEEYLLAWHGAGWSPQPLTLAPCSLTPRHLWAQPNSQKCSGKPMWYQKRRQEASVAGRGSLRSHAARPPGPSTLVSKNAKWPGNERVECGTDPLTLWPLTQGKLGG